MSRICNIMTSQEVCPGNFQLEKFLISHHGYGRFFFFDNCRLVSDKGSNLSLRIPQPETCSAINYGLIASVLNAYEW